MSHMESMNHVTQINAFCHAIQQVVTRISESCLAN